jgi:hypothetical protein
MKYMLLIIGQFDDPTAEPPTAEAFEEYQKALHDAGVLVDGNPLGDIETATTVRLREGRRLVTDGPYAETREYVGGYDIIDVPDLDAALEWAARNPGSRFGRVEVRPIVDMS